MPTQATRGNPQDAPQWFDIRRLLAEGVQPFGDLPDETMTSLAGSIGRKGRLIDPVTMTADLVLCDGHQRLKAMLAAGRTRINIEDIVIIPKTTRGDALRLAVELNMKRRHMPPEEKGEAARRLQREYGWTQGQIAEHMGVSRPSVNAWLKAAAAAAPDDGPGYVLTSDGRMYPTSIEQPAVEEPDEPEPPAKVRQSGHDDGDDNRLATKLLDDPEKLFGQKGRARTLIANLAVILERGLSLDVLSWVERDGLDKDLERLRRAVEATQSQLGALNPPKALKESSK
jgi:ParB-like chromosome segregation protein Spo0J